MPGLNTRSVLEPNVAQTEQDQANYLLRRISLTKQADQQEDPVYRLDRFIRSVGGDPSKIPLRPLQEASTPREAEKVLRTHVPEIFSHIDTPIGSSLARTLLYTAPIAAGAIDLTRYGTGLVQAIRGTSFPVDPGLFRQVIQPIVDSPDRHTEITPGMRNVLRQMLLLSNRDLRAVLSTLERGALNVVSGADRMPRSVIARLLNEAGAWRPGNLIAASRQRPPGYSIELTTFNTGRTAPVENSVIRETWLRRLLRGPILSSSMPSTLRRVVGTGGRLAVYGIPAAVFGTSFVMNRLPGARQKRQLRKELDELLAAIHGKDHS